MPQFRKKPVVIEAEHFFSYMDAPRIVSWIEANGGKATYGQEHGEGVKILISTLEGVMYASVSDWIIKGTKGEFYPCKPDIFRDVYEEVPKRNENSLLPYLAELQ